MIALGARTGKFLPSKTHRAILLGIVVLAIFYLALSEHSRSKDAQPTNTPTTPLSHSGNEAVPELPHYHLPEFLPATKWSWDARRDRNDHSLDAAQCASAFPDLYYEINRAASFWRERTGGGKLTKEHYSLDWSEDGGLQVMIYNQQVCIGLSSIETGNMCANR